MFEARFKGQDGFMGFRTGQIYQLTSSMEGSNWRPHFILRNKETGFWCVHYSLEDFLDNWTVVRRIIKED